jgi:RNA 2',3'-cyclic 3'-phosphodiesterase
LTDCVWALSIVDRQSYITLSRPTSNLRLFVAVYPPAEIVRSMLDRLARLSLPDRAQPTPAEQVHLTLQFIGDTPAAEMDDTIESVRRAASGLPAFTLHLHELIALPERGPKRLIAAETDGPPTLVELQKRLALRLAKNVRERPGEKYRPHITLCRFASPVKGYTLEGVSTRLDGSFAVERIALMRSTLSSAGATHREVVSVPLEGPST